MKSRKKYTYHKDGTQASGHEIFVFGSNLAGRHGAGAAAAARAHYGAVYGEGIGLHGRSYAIPTKDKDIETMPLDEIKPHIEDFLKLAKMTLHTRSYFMTRIGCGLAGYKDEDIAPLFKGATTNINFPEEWEKFLEA